MFRIAINGFGRIGRNILRSFYENGYHNSDNLHIVAINDLGDPQVNAHLLSHDTTHGAFSYSVKAQDDHLLVNGDRIQVLNERNPAQLPWGGMDVDLVLECTGLFTQRAKAAQHLEAGAQRVLISAPGSDVDATIVHGVNHTLLRDEHRIVSNASCTTNCLAPLAQAFYETIGIESGLVTTVHAYTNDQVLTDVYHPDLLRARSATQSMIPTKTGAAAAIGEVIPELKGRLDGLAVRVPVINVSLLDFTFQPRRETSVNEINRIITQAAGGNLSGVLTINSLPLVSSDFNHNPASCIFDAAQTKVIGDTVKVLAWYDNEWGFANRMLDNAVNLSQLEQACYA